VGIGVSYLSLRSGLSRFLSLNPALAKCLGENPAKETRFLERVEPSVDQRLAGKARLSFPKGSNSEQAAPATYLERLPKAIVSSSGDARLLEAQSLYFLFSNPSLLDLIGTDSAMRDLLAGRTVPDPARYREEIVEEALEKLDDHSPRAKQAFMEDPVKARMVALNVSGIAEVLKESHFLKDVFLSGDVRSAVVEELARKVESYFPAGSPVSEFFLKENPVMAAYLLDNAELRSSLAASNEAAQEFVNNWLPYKEDAIESVARRAGGLLSASSFFTDGEIDSNPLFAALILGAESPELSPTLADSVNSDRTSVDSDIDYVELLGSHRAAQARSYFEASEVFTEEFFADHPGIAMASVYSASFRQALRDSEEIFRELIVPAGSNGVAAGIRLALEGYMSGLASGSDEITCTVDRVG